ncbi:alpha-ketoacid dehydrogenase subunit beta [Fimbriimonadia bacterium ATM]|nr:MAG: alpha-ketoacid dehydrogenase subunit beta [Armatimonadota bacterium]MBC6968515.1 alpha-ketoacid dehydrogenase subunit beta [Armatimonadota bacterium]MCE7898646.1 alpha-ketoacid dehydrogenase subunit beta [Armatimonadetes bacterium ATM1]MDL1928061.1 alpha-ketoacid dehydrogenase subunit beta [Fimbriimonadia bacterium ATM]RIJ98369.1 MAG: alpha-ketoacid dehydrogenase subunit beta [Armatimonadota bacterium]
MPTLTYREALRQSIVEEIERDEDVFLIGEDIGRYQGTFRVTQGLFERFKQKRVLDTPISEPGIVGIATGAAMMGLRPIVEMMTMSFSILALDQIINHAAKVHYMSGGQFSVPMVIRGPGGAANQLSAQHSHSLEGWYAHVPGLKVVAPSTPADVYGMLKTSVRDDNPVIFTENPGLYGIKGEIPEDTNYLVPFGQAAVRHEGTDISLIGYSRMAHVCMEVAEALDQEGVSAEVIDVRSLVPLDTETIFGSVRKTHRAVVVYEDWRNGGYGAEIVARIQESCFDDLDAPVGRVGGLNVPMPYARNLELLCIPNKDDALAVARATLG